MFCWTPTTPCLTSTWPSTRPWVSPWPATAFPLRRRPSRPISTSTPLFGPNSTVERSPRGNWWWSDFPPSCGPWAGRATRRSSTGLTSPAWESRVTCSRGRRRCAGPWPPAAPWPSSPTASLRPSGAALPAVRFRTAFPTFLFLRTLDSRSPGGSFSTLCSTIWAFPTRAAPWWWATPWAPTFWEPRTPVWTPSGITPRAAPPAPISPVLIAANFDQIENFILGRGV